jgi:hypothetical protein
MIYIQQGPELYATLSTILFDRWGSKTNQEVTVIDSPADIQSGQVFDDWPGQLQMTITQDNKAEWLTLCKPYKDLAENQLWILNNESVQILNGTKLLMPGSGLCWLANILQPRVRSIHIVDISRQQVKFCLELWEYWNGNNYAQFAWDYIKRNDLQHYELDIADLDPMNRLRLRKEENFVAYVNEQFEKLLPNFSAQWVQVKQDKRLYVRAGSIVDCVLDNKLSEVDVMWESNILDYKWTYMHHTEQQIAKYKETIKSKHLR